MAHRFTEGQKVKFRPTHNKALELRGTVKKVSADHDVLTVTAEPDGKAVETERDFDAHASDCTEA